MGGGAITSATPLHVTPFSRGFGGEAITSSTSYLACVTCSRGGWGSGFGWELELGSGWGKNIRYIPLHVIPQEKSFLLVRGLSHQHPFFL